MVNITKNLNFQAAKLNLFRKPYKWLLLGHFGTTKPINTNTNDKIPKNNFAGTQKQFTKYQFTEAHISYLILL